MSEITKEQLKEAYIKLKSNIYYDTTELFQRRKLAEFETGLVGTNEIDALLSSLHHNLDKKFEKLVSQINNYHINNKDFDNYLDQIKLIYLPKKFDKKNDGENFLSNQRVYSNYNIDQVTVFADIPIELHLISILWLIRFGFKLDSILNDECQGNRLVLNKAKDGIIKGSGLFKPYASQYQKWRDLAVDEAQRRLNNGSKIAFLNLDIKDYFYSVRLDFESIEKTIFGKQGYKGGSNIHDIFKSFHFLFTKKLSLTKYPNKLINNIPPGKFVLPIGIPSSYVLANYYLHEFDNRIRKLIPHVYYSRYVDDLLIVVENPDFDFHMNEKCEDIRFNFDKYSKTESVKFATTEKKYLKIVSKTERFILETFYPLVKLIDCPNELKPVNAKRKKGLRIFEINCLKGAYFQGEKTLLYFFDNEESTAVIDKLKQELEERSSEFRDFPDDEQGEESFDEQAYHLVFDGTEGKIRTLKDYKENRYGLSVFLANRIFSALRRSKRVDKEETVKLLRLFKGLNNLEHFRLWEKIFTFFLVNEDRDGFVEFYKHTLEQISKLRQNIKIRNSSISYNDVANSLMDYFDIALEMPLALNPKFIKRNSKHHRILEIFHYQFRAELRFIDHLTLTKPDSFYLFRFRICNLIRHHYVAHPLLNYTKAAGRSYLSLVDRSILDRNEKFEHFDFSTEMMDLSPRRVKFWECCIAVAYRSLLKESLDYCVSTDERYQYTSIFTENSEDENFVLSKAYKLYSEINLTHFPSNVPPIEQFFSCNFKDIEPSDGKNKVTINEVHPNSDGSFISRPRISVANTIIKETDIESSIKGQPNIDRSRYLGFAKLLNESRKEDVNLIVLPEFSTPYAFVPSLAKYSERNYISIVTGLEHWKIEDICYNFIVTILPIRVQGMSDAIVTYRLKNHYAHVEELIIRGFGYKVPKPKPYRYDLVNWRNLYFSAYYCFELADTLHRSIFRSKIDLLIASEWNKDTPYFSNIVEALSRDLHCYIAQVNTSQFGDTRLTQPTETIRKDLLKLKGGKNDTILVEDFDLKALREFQLKHFERIKADNDNSFKPMPPDWEREFVRRRIENRGILTNETD